MSQFQHQVNQVSMLYRILPRQRIVLRARTLLGAPGIATRNKKMLGMSQFLTSMGIRCITTNPDSHWQSGKIECHGSFLQVMLKKMDKEHPISDFSDLTQAVNQATHAKNGR